MFDCLLSVSLTFFGVFCVLIGYLTFRSKYLPAILGLLMMATGLKYWINSLRLFLALPIPYLPWVTHNEVGVPGIREIGLLASPPRLRRRCTMQPLFIAETAGKD